MALTPEDVVNKRFQSTKFREGYDQDEVDDFLDEVVIELRRLGQENEELRQRLADADARVAGQQEGAAPAAAAPAFAAIPEPVEETVEEVVVEEPVVEQPVVEAPAEPVALAGQDDPEATNSLFMLARRLHEEHVRDGVTRRDALVAEGESRAAQTIADADSRSATMIADAESRAATTISDAESRAAKLVADAEERANKQIADAESRVAELESERTALQGKVDELREFEAEYRSSLRGFIEGQLRDLDATGADAPADAAQDDAEAAAEGQQEEQPTGWGRPQGFASN